MSRPLSAVDEPDDQVRSLLDQEEGWGDEATPEELEERRQQATARRQAIMRGEELDKRRAREGAAQDYAAEVAPRARRYSAREFLSRPRPTRLVEGLLYVDSLARMWGLPGCGKTFVALDLVLRICLGMRWAGRETKPGPVFFVMAEGAAVNAARTDAWLTHHGVDPQRLYEADNLHVYDEAIPLVEGGINQLLEDAAELRPVLIVLDTKNAMMVGEENSATDSAAMRRALDALRRASGACVLLIDHAGYNADHARGSTAVRAAMDTELQVTASGEGPQEVKVAVVRDKAADTGFTRRFHLEPAESAAVLVRPPAAQDSLDDALVDLDDLSGPVDSDWQTADGLSIPASVDEYEGRGQVALPDLARYMAHEASTAWGDPGSVGRSRSEAEKELKDKAGHAPSSVHRAWSALHALGLLEPAKNVKQSTGKHRWVP